MAHTCPNCGDRVTFDDLPELQEAIRRLRLDALVSDCGETLSPEAEQLYLLALGMLESAERYATLANYARMQRR